VVLGRPWDVVDAVSKESLHGFFIALSVLLEPLNNVATFANSGGELFVKNVEVVFNHPTLATGHPNKGDSELLLSGLSVSPEGSGFVGLGHFDGVRVSGEVLVQDSTVLADLVDHEVLERCPASILLGGLPSEQGDLLLGIPEVDQLLLHSRLVVVGQPTHSDSGLVTELRAVFSALRTSIITKLVLVTVSPRNASTN